MMRKILALLWLGIALTALIGLIATAFGVPLGEGARPMLFARALVISVGLFVVTWKWNSRRRPTSRK